MDLIKISKLLSSSNIREYRDDDYWIDRLCHRYSIIIFSVFAVLVTTKAYIGDPIDCWAPPEFKASYERYAETLCFVNGTYYISSTEIDIPIDPKHRYSNRVRYYQWTPFILLLQALTMYFPRFIWLSLNSKYGINIRNLVDAAKKFESVDSYGNKEKILVYICKNLLRTINYNEFTNDRKYLRSKKKKDYYLKHKFELKQMLNQFEKKQHLKSTQNKKEYNSNELKQLKKKIHEISPKSKSSNNNEETKSLTMLQSKITTISKKHFLNMLITGYEINKDIEKIDRSNRKDKTRAYIIDKKTIKRIENLDLNKLDIENKDTKLLKHNMKNLSRTYLSNLYLLIKLFYLIISFLQLFFLDRLIGNKFYMIGISLIKSFIYNIEWPHMDIFPRMTLCEIFIREVGTVHPYLIQCVLRINLFNEVIFVLVWYWLVFVILITSTDLILKFLNLLFGCSNCQRKLFALKYLELIHLNSLKNVNKNDLYNDTKEVLYDNIINTEGSENDLDNLDKEKYAWVMASKEEEFDLFEGFCEANFNNDTIFALKVIEQNSSSLIVSEIIEHLWLHFKFSNCVYSSDSNDYILKKILFKKNINYDHNSDADDDDADDSSFNTNNSGKNLVNKNSKNLKLKKMQI